MRSITWPLVGALAGLSLIAAVVALALFGGQPSVHSKTTGEDFPCLRTWDIVLNGAYNEPEGFDVSPPLEAEHIGDRCVAAAHQDFRISLWMGSASAGLALVATVFALRQRRITKLEG